MNVWFASDLGRYLIGVGLSSLCLGIVGVLLARLCASARTEWRLLVVGVSVFAVVSTLGVWFLAMPAQLGAISVEARPAVTASQPFQTVSQQSEAPASASMGLSKPVTRSGLFIVQPAWILALWGSGTAVSLLWLATQSWLLLLWRKRYDAGSACFEAPISAPFCGGVFRSFIAVPIGFTALPEAERSAVLAHEEAHLSLRHPLAKLVVDLATCLFWWLPFMYLLRRELSDLLERQCDEQVVRQLGSGVGLAKGLLRFAELQNVGQPSLTLSILRRHSDLEGRIRRLSTLGEPPMKPQKTHLVLAAFSLGLVSTAISAGLQVRPNAISEARRYAGGSLGAALTYTTRYGNSNPTTRTVRFAKEHALKDAAILEFQSNSSRHTIYSYLMATPQGLRAVDNRGMGGEPGYDLSRSRGITVPLPLREGYQWTWSEEFRGQTMMGADGKAPETPPTVYKGKVVAAEQEVKVPAGTYKAAVIETSVDVKFSKWMVRTYWVKDVGLVKEETFDDKGSRTGLVELSAIGSGKLAR